MADALPTIPDVNFVVTDPQATIDNIIGTYQTLVGVTLAEADPRRLFLLSLAYIIIQQRNMIDASGKSNLLYYAKGAYLDHLGAMRKVLRLPPSFALTTMRIALSAAQPMPIGIPTGTRFTDSGAQLYWETTAPVTIAPGALSIDVPAEAMTAGVIGNGIVPGVITTLVDPIPYVQSVTNIDVTQGGSDTETDDAYRARIYEAPAAFSIAGPEDAYIFWAMTANQSIIDVSAVSPAPAYVDVYPLLEGGVLPEQAILDEVEAVLSDETLRPLADRVTAHAPSAEDYEIDFTYYIRRVDQASQADIAARVNDAVVQFKSWQNGKIGRDINPDELITRVKAAGAKRLVIVSPAFTSLDTTAVAQLSGAPSVNYGGLEDE